MEYQFSSARVPAGSSGTAAMQAGISGKNLLQGLQEYRGG